MTITRAMRRAFQAEQARQPERLRNVPHEEWPTVLQSLILPPHEVWRSRHFLVQIYREPSDFRRITVNRAALTDNGEWVAAITWDELQRLKDEIGLGEWWAVECYPPNSEVINVANIRHLWLLPDPPPYGWHTKKE